MSKPADNGEEPEEAAFAALEGAVSEALKRLAVAAQRAEAAEKKSADLNQMMRGLTNSPAEAGEVLTRLRRLESENADLKERLKQGRAGVERMLAKIRFLESQG